MDATKLSTLVAGHTGLTGADLRAALRAKRVLSLKKTNRSDDVSKTTWLTGGVIQALLHVPGATPNDTPVVSGSARWKSIKAALQTAITAGSADAANALDRLDGNGADMTLAVSQADFATLAPAVGLSDPEAWKLRGIGAVLGSDLSVSGVDTAISESDDDLDALIARLPAEVTWQALTDAVTELSKAMQAYPASCAAMLGIEPAAIEPRRTALLGLVTTWRGKIDAGDDTAGMPGDAATALAATAGE